MTPPLNLLSYGENTPTLLGPVTHAGAGHALIGRLRLGRDAWLGAGTVIRADGHYVDAGHDLHLGRGASVHIAHDVYPTIIGHHVSVGANAMVHACTVGDGCVIEDDAVVLDGSVLADGVVLEADGVVLDAAITERWLARFDPSLAATHAELGLARVNWENCARAGSWGRGYGWG
jgi:carbonic anhydrase/acetyltransferase-like protein (isoleucine patch superfamily)